MRIRTISIKGYGRFNDQKLDFAPGLQIVVGPNERGKSTIRSFIADMLYGQKVNDTQRVYEESNELRQPWNGTGHYGGSLIYELDDGHTIEVIREFDRKTEKIEVIDRDSGDDITGTFTRYRNRELDFARQHLGLNKRVFLNTATISHVTLDELGDSDALDQIREKLLALTDTGGGTGTVEAALRLLGERVSAIGMSGAKSKPLAQAREALHALELAYKETLTARDSMAQLAVAHKQMVAQCNGLRMERQTLENTLKAIDRHEELDRLEEVRRIHRAIDEITRQTLALGRAREFPLDRDEEIQSLHMAWQTATNQLEITESQRVALLERMESDVGVERGLLARSAPDFPNALELQLNQAIATRSQLDDRIVETESLIKAAEDRVAEVRQQIADLPDFSRLAADPVEWLSQLASSFSVAMRARDEECALRKTLQEEVDILERQNEPHQALFQNRDNFSALAREYALQLRLHESQKDQHASHLHTLQGTYAELKGESGAYLPIGVGCLIGAVVMAYFHFTTDVDTGIFTLVAGSVGLVFLAMWGVHRGHMRRLAERLEEARESVNSVSKAAGDPELEVIDQMLRQSDVGSIRELEALHDQFRTVELELKVRREALNNQDEKAREAEERIPLLLERFRETFTKAGEEIDGENDVQDAAARAIARYQEYRETKRRSSTNRSVLERHETELKRLKGLVEEADENRKRLEEETRQFVTQHGLSDADSFESVSELIAAYRNAFARDQESRGRQDVLGEDLRDKEAQRDKDREAQARCAAALEAALRPFGLKDIAAWNELAAEARSFAQLEAGRHALEADCRRVLGDETLAAFAARVEALGDPGERPATDRAALREAIDDMNSRLEEVTAEEHRLHLKLTEQGNSTRAVSELEEELAALRHKIRALEEEGEATSYAMALVEDVARDTHAYVAPRLAEEASKLLAEITTGSYEELTLGRDLSVHVRIPETQRLQDAPEKSLSKGTVDQIYLALRLAFVQSLNATGEGIPMLLDDPFANYDDGRLAKTMALVSGLVGRNQVILFTCREDVVTVAEQHGASIIRL